MHFCMKATPEALASVKAKLASAYERAELTQAEIARLSKVDPSQVSRICRGQFRTLSPNVVQICNVLEVDAGLSSELMVAPTGSWTRMLASLRDLWDETPEGAESIMRMLDAVAALRRSE